MADVLCNAAISFLADALLGLDPAAPTLKIGLFVNAETIECDTPFSALDECTATGYAEIVIDPGTWLIADPAACVVECSYGNVSFLLTDDGGGETVFGHYIRDTTRDLWWAREWDTPWEIPAGGGVAVVSPFYTSKQCSG